MKKWSYDLPYITEKQKEIMELIYKFRFMDRIQIQTLMKHKDYKRINVWLKDLVKKDYLYRIYERKIPLNIKPAVYFLAPTGVRFTRNLGNYDTNHKLYREKERSEEFRSKCLLIANLYIDILKKTGPQDALNFFKTKQDFDEYDEIIKPYPDGLLSLNVLPSDIVEFLNNQTTPKSNINTSKKNKRKSKKEYLYFLELIGEKTPRYYLRYRIQQYIEYSDGHQTAKPYPHVMFVLPNKRTKIFLVKFVENRLDETLFDSQFIFFFTTIDVLKNEGLFDKIWTRIISKS